VPTLSFVVCLHSINHKRMSGPCPARVRSPPNEKAAWRVNAQLPAKRAQLSSASRPPPAHLAILTFKGKRCILLYV
jgi:hypothetical protein